MGTIICLIAKESKSLKKIETAIRRLSKASSLCSNQKMPQFEHQIISEIRRVNKLKFEIESGIEK